MLNMDAPIDRSTILVTLPQALIVYSLYTIYALNNKSVKNGTICFVLLKIVILLSPSKLKVFRLLLKGSKYSYCFEKLHKICGNFVLFF